jgi:hypothetical protein
MPRVTLLLSYEMHKQWIPNNSTGLPQHSAQQGMGPLAGAILRFRPTEKLQGNQPASLYYVNHHEIRDPQRNAVTRDEACIPFTEICVRKTQFSSKSLPAACTQSCIRTYSTVLYSTCSQTSCDASQRISTQLATPCARGLIRPPSHRRSPALVPLTISLVPAVRSDTVRTVKLFTCLLGRYIAEEQH